MPGISDVLSPASAAISGAEGIYQFIDSIGKEKKDKAALASLSDPFYKIQDEYFTNRNIGREAAANGIPAATKDYLTTNSERGLGAGISGVLQSGGNANDIGKLYGIYNSSLDRTAAEDADQKIKNMQYYINLNKDLAGQKTMKSILEDYQPNQEKRRQLTQNISADTQNAYNGFNTAAGSVSAFGTSIQNNQLLNSLFKKPATTNWNGVAYNNYANQPISDSALPATASSTGQITVPATPVFDNGFSDNLLNSFGG